MSSLEMLFIIVVSVWENEVNHQRKRTINAERIRDRAWEVRKYLIGRIWVRSFELPI